MAEVENDSVVDGSTDVYGYIYIRDGSNLKGNM